MTDQHPTDRILADLSTGRHHADIYRQAHDAMAEIAASYAAQLEDLRDNGNYEPYNCRFVTRVVNNRNRRSNKIVVYNGESMCLKDCCEKSGLDYGKTRRYLYNHKDKTIDHLLMSIPK